MEQLLIWNNNKRPFLNFYTNIYKNCSFLLTNLYTKSKFILCNYCIFANFIIMIEIKLIQGEIPKCKKHIEVTFLEYREPTRRLIPCNSG